MLKKIKSLLCIWITGLTPTEIECNYQSREYYRAKGN
jgi:hypothetical protein